MQLTVVVDGKTRVIRDKQIDLLTNNDLYCTYRGHTISISKQEATNDFYVTVKDKTGMYAVQGGYGGPHCRYGVQTMQDCLVICIRNILV